MSEELKYRFEVINIKLQSVKDGIERKEAYIKLITDLVDNKIHSAVAENKHLILYSYYKRKTNITGIEYIYGKIGKGFYFENESGQAIDIESRKSETIVNDTTKIFNATISDFIFIPDAHRFCIQLGSKISGYDVRKFFTNALLQVKDKEDKLRIELENEPKAIEEIISAKKIHKIDYIVTYTNDDVLGATAELFDKRLKRSQIGKIEIKAESDHNEYLNTKGEELLEGGIELARSNGTIRSATITTNDNKRKTVKSSDVPLKIEIKSNAESFRSYIVNLIMKTFRTESNDA